MAPAKGWADQLKLDKARNLRLERIRDARKKGTHTKEDWEEMLEASAKTCCRCGAVGFCCKDHIVPIFMGGSDSIRNIQPLCGRCNSAKGPECIDHRIGKPWMRPEWAQNNGEVG